ncbi:hypothetical protein MTO96_035304 [Rhipicephalus appendiculatus]
MHQCIYRLTLVIYAVRHFHGCFYQEISLEDGIVMVLVQVPAMEDPCNEFMMPYLHYLRRMRNLQQTSSVVFQNPYSHIDNVPYEGHINPIVEEEGLLEFNDSRLVKSESYHSDRVHQHSLSASHCSQMAPKNLTKVQQQDVGLQKDKIGGVYVHPFPPTAPRLARGNNFQITENKSSDFSVLPQGLKATSCPNVFCGVFLFINSFYYLSQDEGIGAPVQQVSGFIEVLGGRLAGPRARHLGPFEITANPRTARETLTHLTALYPRRMRHRDEATIQVHAPQQLNVTQWETCGFDFTNLGAFAAASSAAEQARKHPGIFNKRSVEAIEMLALLMPRTES